MSTSGTRDKIYSIRPGWSVEHRLAGPDVQLDSRPIARSRHDTPGAVHDPWLSFRKKIALPIVAAVALLPAAIAIGRPPSPAPLNRIQENTATLPATPNVAPAPPILHTATRNPQIHRETAKNYNSTEVTVNDESIPVPTNGTIRRTYSNGQSAVDITIQNTTNSE